MFPTEMLRSAHKFATRHRDKLENDPICGCFYCVKIFNPKEIDMWLNEGSGTALCPYCYIDSILGESSGYPITYEFLKAMNYEWFGGINFE